MRPFVIFLAALSVAAASDNGERQLFSFSFGSPPEGPRPDSSASAPKKQSKGSLASFLSSFSQNSQSSPQVPAYVPSGDETQNDSPLGPGGDGAGPLNYPEYEEDEQRKKPKRPTISSYSNDISSDAAGGYRPGGRRPVSDGYKPGLPPGIGGNYGSSGGGKSRPPHPQNSPFSFFRGYKPGRGPPPQTSASSSSSNGPPNSYYSGHYKGSGSESLPQRIRSGIMGLFSSPTFAFAMAPFNFKISQGPQGLQGLRPQQREQEEPKNDSSGSPADPVTFYLAPPSKDAPSFYRMKKPSLKSLFSMESSESNNQRPLSYLYREQSQRQKGNNFVLGVDPKNMISPQNQLVSAIGPNGKPIVLEVAPLPPKASLSSKDTNGEYVVSPVKSSSKYRYVSISKDPEPVIYDYPSASESLEGNTPQVLTLASQPNLPFPSLTQEEEQQEQVVPTPKSQYVATISESVSLFPSEPYKTIQAAPSTTYVAALLSPPQALQDVKPSTPQYATILTESS